MISSAGTLRVDTYIHVHAWTEAAARGTYYYADIRSYPLVPYKIVNRHGTMCTQMDIVFFNRSLLFYFFK